MWDDDDGGGGGGKRKGGRKGGDDDPWGGGGGGGRGGGGGGGGGGGRRGGGGGGGGGGGKGGGKGGGGPAPSYQPYVPKFLREMGGGAAPDGSIAGRKRALDAKSAALDQDGDDEDESNLSFSELQAKIAAEGGTLMTSSDYSKGGLKKTKRNSDAAEEGGQEGGKKEEKKEEEEEKPELDKDGRPIIKFKKVDVSQLGSRKKMKKKEGGDGKPGVKNQTLLSFGDDE